MSFGGLILTNNGRNELANAEAGGRFNITELCFGDGFYNGSFIQKNELTNTIMTLPVSNIYRDEDKVIVECDFNSKDAPEAFYLREIGIIANGKLCYYDNSQDDVEYIDPNSEVYLKQRRMRFVLLISSETNITIQINSNLYALRDDLVNHAMDSLVHFTSEEKIKLTGIETNANNYTHPATHPAAMITEDEIHRFVSDSEKNKWNNIFENAKDYADDTYRQATGYTDSKIAALINGAPETLDTLKEIADAMEENESVVDALDNAIGQKANDVEFQNHKNNETIHITEDERTAWNNSFEDAKNYADRKFVSLTGGGDLEITEIARTYFIKRDNGNTSAIGFKNPDGILGYVGYSSASNSLRRWSKNFEEAIILDTVNYKDCCPPKKHSSAVSDYGVGTENEYGHVKTINNLTASEYVDGEVLSAYQGKILNDKIENLTTELNQLNGLNIQFISNLNYTQSGSNSAYSDITLSKEFKNTNYFIMVDTNDYEINSNLSGNVKYSISNKTKSGFRITLHSESGNSFGSTSAKILIIGY